MLKMVLAASLAVPAAATVAVAVTGVAVVDVKEGGRGHRIIVPVPLALVQAAAAFVPEKKCHIELGWQAERYLPVTHDILAALAQSADGELVRVEQPGTEVVIRKEGNLLRIHVKDGARGVTVNVPLDLALSALPDTHGRFTASRVVWALRHARFTRLVEVEGRNGEHVTVTVF